MQNARLYRSYLTLEEAVAAVEAFSDDDQDDKYEICVLPPDEDGNITDEEHIGE